MELALLEVSCFGVEMCFLTNSLVVRYGYTDDSWTVLPVELTKVNAFGFLNGHEILQVGGQFTATDHLQVIHTNLIAFNIETNGVLPGIPSASDGEVFAFGTFPNEPKYSFLGGNFSHSGVEQMKSGLSVWTISPVGNTLLSPPVLALTSRNQAEVLFAGGAFVGSLSRLDIGRQEWSRLIPTTSPFEGIVRALLMTCPSDPQFQYQELPEPSSHQGYFYSPKCDIPVGAGPDFRCPDDLSNWQIFGLSLTVLVTLLIVLSVAGVGYRMHRKNAAPQTLDFELDFQ